MNMPRRSEETDGYEAFLENVGLINIGLKSCTVSLDRTGLFNAMALKEKARRVVNDKYRVTETGKGFFELAGSFSVTISKSGEAPPPLSIECEFEARFHAKSPVTNAFVERFAASDFQIVIVPYARQFIWSITAQMSIPPVVIPLSTKAKGSSDRKSVIKEVAK